MAEAYPELQANESFQHLEARITGLENALADRRELYNESVNLNNVRNEQFPDVLLARNFGAFALLEFGRRKAGSGDDGAVWLNCSTRSMSAWLDFPQRLDPLECRLIIAAAVMIALAAFVAAFVFVRRARLIEDTPTSRLRSAALGYVELEGEAVMMAGVPIVAPFTLTPCAWFRYCIEERVDDKGALGRWRTHTHGASDGLFALRDDTGRCMATRKGRR